MGGGQLGGGGGWMGRLQKHVTRFGNKDNPVYELTSLELCVCVCVCACLLVCFILCMCDITERMFQFINSVLCHF